MKGSKEQCLYLIESTLYTNRKWSPEAVVTGNGIEIQGAITKVKDTFVRLDFSTGDLYINDEKNKISKTLKTDLLSIVKLKIAKTLSIAWEKD